MILSDSACNSIQKLYIVYVNNGYDCEDAEEETVLIVAKGTTEAITRSKEILKKIFPYGGGYCVEEVAEVDGYKIILEK